MIPRILEYEDGHIIVTENAYTISEIKALIDKYKNPRPYLTYVHLMTAPDSPYINEDMDTKSDSIVYELTQTLGEFDVTDPLVDAAVEKFNNLYTSTAKNYYDSLKISIDKMAKYLRDAPIEAGKDGNLSEIIRIHKEGGATLRSFKDIEKQVDEELKTKMRGKTTMGEY